MSKKKTLKWIEAELEKLPHPAKLEDMTDDDWWDAGFRNALVLVKSKLEGK